MIGNSFDANNVGPVSYNLPTKFYTWTSIQKVKLLIIRQLFSFIFHFCPSNWRKLIWVKTDWLLISFMSFCFLGMGLFSSLSHLRFLIFRWGIHFISFPCPASFLLRFDQHIGLVFSGYFVGYSKLIVFFVCCCLKLSWK